MTPRRPPFHIPAIERERVLELVERIWPLVERDGALWTMAPVDPWCRAFTWDPELRQNVTDRFEAIQTLRTLHTFAAPVLFKPTLAEVLAQLPPGADPDAFSVQGPRDGAALDAEREAYAAGFHVATTTLYRRISP